MVLERYNACQVRRPRCGSAAAVQGGMASAAVACRAAHVKSCPACHGGLLPPPAAAAAAACTPMRHPPHRLPQTVAFCGVFPEIRRAWASVDSSLFLWRFDKWCAGRLAGWLAGWLLAVWRCCVAAAPPRAAVLGHAVPGSSPRTNRRRPCAGEQACRDVPECEGRRKSATGDTCSAAHHCPHALPAAARPHPRHLRAGRTCLWSTAARSSAAQHCIID